MPRYGTDTIDMETFDPATGFSFSGERGQNLQEDSYTMVNVYVDISYSVGNFIDLIQEMLKSIVRGVKMAPTKNNILLRVCTFGSNIKEIHGYRLVPSIDVDKDYPVLQANGNTVLYDAAYDAVTATKTYAKHLFEEIEIDNISGDIYLITDGDDTWSKATTPAMIKAEKANSPEYLGRPKSVLIGVNVTAYQAELERFRVEADFDEFIDAGDANDKTFAAIAGYVSSSVTASSKQLVTGQSQPVQSLKI